MSHLNGSHFAALFKSRIGYPALQYQTQLWMARARELLDTTDQSIAAVAAATGYPDSFYFARQFKKVHGDAAWVPGAAAGLDPGEWTRVKRRVGSLRPVTSIASRSPQG